MNDRIRSNVYNCAQLPNVCINQLCNASNVGMIRQGHVHKYYVAGSQQLQLRFKNMRIVAVFPMFYIADSHWIDYFKSRGRKIPLSAMYYIVY